MMTAAFPGSFAGEHRRLFGVPTAALLPGALFISAYLIDNVVDFIELLEIPE